MKTRVQLPHPPWSCRWEQVWTSQPVYSLTEAQAFSPHQPNPSHPEGPSMVHTRTPLVGAHYSSCHCTKMTEAQSTPESSMSNPNHVSFRQFARTPLEESTVGLPGSHLLHLQPHCQNICFVSLLNTPGQQLTSVLGSIPGYPCTKLPRTPSAHLASLQLPQQDTLCTEYQNTLVCTHFSFQSTCCTVQPRTSWLIPTSASAAIPGYLMSREPRTDHAYLSFSHPNQDRPAQIASDPQLMLATALVIQLMSQGTQLIHGMTRQKTISSSLGEVAVSTNSQKYKKSSKRRDRGICPPKR